MKILFAVPPYHRLYYSVPPGTGIVATVARNAGFDVQVVLSYDNERIIEYNKRLVEKVKNEKIDIVALGGGSPYYRYFEQLISMCKAAGAITVIGGYIVDSLPEIVAKNIGADYCIAGEGEYTFVKLVNALMKGKDVDKICGLYYMNDGKLVITSAPECVPDLDKLPFVDGDLTHLDYSLGIDPTLYLIASRSCPYQCTFCYHLKGAGYRQKSLNYFFSELDYYLNNYGAKIKTLMIIDEMFAMNKSRLLDFCSRIKKYNLPFWVSMRVDSVDEESLIALKEAGAFLVSYGLESASNKVLSSMNKKITIEQAKEAFKLTAKHGLKIQANIIIGDIDDDLETIKESENFFWKHASEYDLNIHMIMTLPGTRLYKYAIEKGIISDELAFLKSGCPIINVSKLSDNFHTLLSDKYGGYQISKDIRMRRPLQMNYLELDVHKNGSCTYKCYCPECYTQIVMENENVIKPRKNPYLGCPKCNKRVNLHLSSFVSSFPYEFMHFPELYLKQYTGCKIVVWGVISKIRSLLICSETLRECLVKIVDINWNNMAHETYCGLSVENPEVLKQIDFEYIITSTVERRQEVIDSLKEMGKFPRFIEIDTALVS